MIKRTIKETVREYDVDGKVVRETVTETTEDDDTMYFPPFQTYQETVKPWWGEPSCTCKTIAKEDTMQRVGEFEKVSFEQFRDAMKDEFYRGQELPPAIEDDLKKMWEEIALPSRATTGSAGYDFKAPFTFEMRPGETMKIPTGIRVKIDEGWWLGCLPRSGLGFKFRMQFDNTMGVIDSDYYFSDNEGHIFAKITNDSKSQKIVHVEAGNGFMQAIFIPYGITYSDDATGVRNGGMGSTDSKA